MIQTKSTSTLCAIKPQLANMSFLYIFVIVQSLCVVLLSSATHATASKPEALSLPTSPASHEFVVAEPENDPEGYSDDTVSRSKRETSPPRKATQMAKQNSTVTHITNTTMMEILSNFSRQAVPDQSFMIIKPSAKKLPDQATRREVSSADKVEVVRVTRSTFDATKPNDISLHMGDLESLTKEADDSDDLMPAAGYNSKKYVLVKKKPKHKKIKMEILEPKMKYKKIKMKVPVKIMKKKKVKGYLVKKMKHHYH